MSIGLTADELASIRSAISDLLPETCTIQKVTYTKNEIGEPERSYSTRAADVPCRLDPGRSARLSGNEQISPMMNYFLVEGTYILTLPYDTTIEETDRVIKDGDTYEVRYVDSGKSWAGSRRVVVMRLEV